MIALDPNALSVRENYALLTGTVLPRPIALVTTRSQQGVVNAAPFSYFTVLTSHPPLLAVSVGRKAGAYKDTSRNAIASGEMVVHLMDWTQLAALNQTAASLPPEESELPLTGWTEAASMKVGVPGIAEAKVRMECVLEQALPLGGEGSGAPPACDLLIARVVQFHLQPELYVDGAITLDAWEPVSRLGGSWYARLGEQRSLERP